MFAIGTEPHSLGDVEALVPTSDEEDILRRSPFEHVPTACQVELLSLFAVTRLKQEHENDVAEVVLVSEPDAASISMGGLHPRASLYERPVNLEESKKQHANFREILRSYGIKGASHSFL